MLKNNGKMGIGRNFIFCLCVICLMFTSFGFAVENSFATDLNDTSDMIATNSDYTVKLENSQNNDVLKADSQDNGILTATVTPKGNIYKSIQDAVNSAKAGDTIKLSGTYHSNGNDRIVIDKKLTLTADSTATFDGKHLSTAIYIKSGGAGSILKNLKFINGNGDIGSAVFIEAKNVRVENCIFEDNHANRGGAVNTKYDLTTASGLTVDNCQFRRNTGYYKDFESFSCGAALTMYGKDSEVKNSIFEDNWVKGKEGTFGGAIQVGLDEPGSNAKVTSCVFKNNKAISIDYTSHGGAGCVRDGSQYTNCIFINNFADEGGALTFHASGRIVDCTFLNNTAGVYGGALSTGFLYDYMNLEVVNCNFDGNQAPNGGAVQANGLNILIDNSNFKNNHVSQNGGAIYVSAEDVEIRDSIFNSNKATVNGGAVYIKGKNTQIKNSSFISNEAVPDIKKLDDGLGGAIYVDSSQALISDNIFRFNTARNGSAIYYDKTGEKLTLENNELFQNQAWVYGLPISAEDIYYEDSEEIKVTLFGGNNIADYDNLAVSNAIYNAAENVNIVINGEYPIYGATNSGELYQDAREYNINVLLTVQHEDGTLIYNEVGHTDYLGEITVSLDNLKPGKYYVSAKHYEDTYYKAINNATTFLVKPKVDNEITKTASKSVLNFEDVVTWTVTVRNHGPNNSSGVKVYDVLPEGLIWLNDTSNGKYDYKSGILDIGDLNVGESFTFDIITVIDTTGEITNNANVTSVEFDTNVTNNCAEKSIYINPAADLAVVKSVSNSKPNYLDYVDWTIAITNNGPDTAHDVMMYDVLPNSMIYISSNQNYDENSGIWNIPSLEKGETLTLVIKCRVNATGMIENRVLVNASEFDYDLTNNNASERIFVTPAADLSVIKSANASNVNFGDIVKWTLVISNNGPDNGSNVRVNDYLPDGFIYLNSTMTKGYYDGDLFVIDNLGVGEKVIIDIITQVDATGNFTNIADVTSDEYDYDLTNNEDNENISVNPACDLEVVKSVSESNPKFADNITWTIEITNNGPDTAHNVTLKDLLPENMIWIDDDSSGEYDPVTGILFIDELDAEETFTLNIDCVVNGTGTIRNIAYVNGSEYDYNMTNNVANESVEVEKSADVSVVKTVNNSSPNYNDLVRWTLIISNKGPDKATDIRVEDSLPEGMVFVEYSATKGFYIDGAWVMCCLENGETQSLEIVARVNKTGTITNVAEIHADEYDYNESNNIDNESVDVPPAVDIAVIINADNSEPLFGEKVVWNIIVKNNGPDNATGVYLHDILPEGLVFVDYTSGKGNYESGIWDIGRLNTGEEISLNITTISDALGIIVNDVKVESREYDWNMSNNNDDDSVNVKPVADLSVVKLVNKISPKYGETVKWTLIAANNGPNMASNVVVEDSLPEGLKFITSDGRYSGGIWNVGTLNAGESKTLEIICKVVATGNFVNMAKIRSDEYDPDESNNEALKSIHVEPASDLSVTKIASKYKYKVGEVIEYVIEVVNNGPDTAYNIKVNEIMDKLLKLKSFKVSKGKFNKFTMAWTIDELGYGESARLLIKAIATASGTVKNRVSVTSDTFDYDMSNNRDYAVVKVDKKAEGKVSGHANNNLPDKIPSNLEMHKTANPMIVLLISLVLSVAFSQNIISKRR